MATCIHSTPAPSIDGATLLLARLFPRWRGDASEPALPPPPLPVRPAPAAAVRELVEA